MPELPEVETVSRTLDPLLAGKVFASVEVLWPRTLASPDAAAFAAAIHGREIQGVRRRAKLVLIELDSCSVVSVHLRMTGELLFVPAGREISPDQSRHLRAAFLFADGSELRFFDMRKFGRITLYSPDQRSILDTAYGIEPLGEGFTADWLYENLRRRKRQLKPLLLDQTFIAGLGNIYVDESLFMAGLHPLSKSNEVTPSQAALLHASIIKSLTGALERRGTTLRDYRSGLGEPGENRSRLLVYGSKPGTPCPRCGTGLQRLVVGQRGSIFCPACQPLTTPGGTPNQ